MRAVTEYESKRKAAALKLSKRVSIPAPPTKKITVSILLKNLEMEGQQDLESE